MGHILTGFHIIKQAIPETTDPCNVSSVSICGSDDLKASKLSGVVLEDLLLFTNLVYLNVSSNNLRFSDFAILPSLMELRMSNNCISNIDCPVSGYMHLKKLDLSNNKLTDSAISKLSIFFKTRLIHLNISSNALATLPEEICNLQSLETLLLDNNHFSDTQLSLLGSLPRLRTLSLNGNEITRYINHSGAFSCLVLLQLNQNHIATIQDIYDLTKLPMLKTVEIRNNPLESLQIQADLPNILSNTTNFDWIPDFILAELYPQSPTITHRVQHSSLNTHAMNILRSTVQHPQIVHYVSQKVIADNISKRTTQSKHGRSEAADSLKSGEKNISTLSEAESELSRMRQRLFIAEQNFKNATSGRL